MESMIVSKSPLKGKCYSCLETLVKLSPSDSSLKALSSCCLYGKVIAPMAVEEASVLDFVARVWKKKVAVVAMVEGSKSPNIFRFSFGSAEDRDWALANGPWCIRGYTLVLQGWTPATDGPVVFKLLRVWIQLLNLPHEYFSIANGFLLGGLVGRVVKVDLEEDNSAVWGNSLKVQVDIDVNIPLFVGCFFELASGAKKWVQVKFEKIGIFCYFCGCLGHQRRGCKLSSPVMVFNQDGVQYLEKSHGRTPLLPATVAEGVEDPKGKRDNLSRRPRRPVMATSRTAGNLEKPLRMEWLPKSFPAGSEKNLPISGVDGVTENLRKEKATVHFPCLLMEEGDRSNEGSKDLDLNFLNDATVSNGMGSGAFTGGPNVVLKSGLLENKDADVGPLKLLNEVNVGMVMGSEAFTGGPIEALKDGRLEKRRGPRSVGPSLFMKGPVTLSKEPSGPVQSEFPGPKEIVCNNLLSLDGNRGSPRNDNGCSSLCGPDHVDKQRDGHPVQPITLLPSTPPEDACVARIHSDEDMALSQFFQAQENLLHDLKHFGKLDLYEIRKIGGDIGRIRYIANIRESFVTSLGTLNRLIMSLKWCQKSLLRILPPLRADPEL
ncbi:hypothetical protein F8388_002034 [Cannabis sativa]|uniref:CCHC-type domain-containing protein n=1 Tax=Cannabis sativa TaxID=3483 RepID=A0A7J6DSE3_CANSA|nr:hypothetical protein F8388_002034 [Cannabis sativa]